MPRIGSVIRDVYRRPGGEALPAHLEHRYGIRVAATTKLMAGVYKVQQDRGPTWVARLSVTGRPIERVEEDAGVLRFLQRQGVPAERCAHPEPVSWLDGRAVLVTEHIEGGALPQAPAARRALGDILGRLQGLVTEPGPTERPAGSLHHLPGYEGYPSQDLAAAAALLADLEGRVRAEHEGTYQAIKELLPKGDDGLGLPESFVHPDPVRTNAIATASGPVLVDWTGAGRGPRLASLAALLGSLAPQHVDDVLAGYQAHTTLTAEELDRLEGVLWVRALWLASWQCWLAVVSSKVTTAFVPDGARIAAIAARARAAAGRL
jgi:Ser/Thr protein kinase RdoA (MazF antagonist)